MSNELGRVEDVVTVGIKHTSNFARRRAMLNMLLRSVRQNYGPSLPILVADDGGSPDLTVLTSFGAQHIALPAASGLSHGRNAIVLATRTPFLALMDDDVLFNGATSLLTLLEALRGSPKTALAGGCYHDMRFDKRDCFNLRFDVDDGGAVVHAKKAHGLTESGCYPVDVRALSNMTHAATPTATLGTHRCARRRQATHNFFLGRTAVLRRFGWDPRQRVMEHETFFYQLFLNQQPVLACPGVAVLHNTSRDDEYRERSFRLKVKPSPSPSPKPEPNAGEWRYQAQAG